MTSGAAVLPLRALLAGKEEDRFTEVLAHLLRDEHILRTFLTRVCGLAALPERLSAFAVSTRVSFEGGTPDLVIEDSGHFLLFEAKVASGLHAEQLLPYARALSARQPDNRKLVRGLYLIVRSRDRAANERDARVQLQGAEVVAQVLTWESISYAFGDAAGSHPDPRLTSYLTDFADVIDWGLARCRDRSRLLKQKRCRTRSLPPHTRTSVA